MAHLFSDPGSIHIGAPYVQHNSKYSREKGKQFVTSPGKRGTGNQGLFSSFVYKPDKDGKKKAGKKKKKEILVPFKHASPAPRTTGSGSYYGTIGGKFEHIPEVNEADKKQQKKKIEKETLRNFVTNPPKKGTYGFMGTTLQREPYKYISDPYGTKEKKDKAEDKKKREKIKHSVPFRSRVCKQEYFDNLSQTYGIDDKIRQKVKKEEEKRSKKKKKQPVVTQPWRPVAPKSGLDLKPLPHVSDPYDKRKLKSKKERENEQPRAIFKPSGVSKSGPTKSILFK